MTVRMQPVMNPEQLRAWLHDKPTEWSASIASRIALRVLPIALDPAEWKVNQIDNGLIMDIFRACSVIRASKSSVTDSETAFRSLQSVYYAIGEHPRNTLSKSSSPFPSSQADAAMRAIYLAIDVASDAAHAASNSQYADSETAGSKVATILELAFAAARGGHIPINPDIKHIVNLGNSASVGSLLQVPLWFNPVPEYAIASWNRARAALLERECNFSLWVDWYDRRLTGEAQGFALPPDNDIVLNRRLIAADNAWWKRESAEVNADIIGWIAELSPPITDPQRQVEAATDWPDDLAADPQANDAPQFISDAHGRIAIDPHAGANALLTDARAAERHAAARRRAAAAAEQLKGHNQADYLSHEADDIFAALGDDIVSGNLAETVLIANQIRIAAENHAAAGPRDDVQPLPTDAARAVATLVDALNLHIGQQPVLAAMDMALVDPEIAPTASPRDLRQIIDDPETAAAFQPRTRDYIDIAAGMAPAEPDPAKRQSRRLGELAANLGRHVVRIISDNRAAFIPLAGGAAAGAAIAATGLFGIGGALTGAGFLLSNMKKHPETWMRIAGPSPASQANMRAILDFIDHYWPSESSKESGDKKP